MTDYGAGHPESGQRQHRHAGAGGDHGHGDHGHGVTAGSDSRYLMVALGLIVAFLMFEVIMAFIGRFWPKT